jgi:hypothetical protein
MRTMYVPGSAIHVHSSYITWTSSHSAQIVFKREIIVDYIICLRHPHSLYNNQSAEKKRRLGTPGSLLPRLHLLLSSGCNADNLGMGGFGV